MRTFLLHGVNNAPEGKVFDGFLPHGARAGYLDIFRPDAIRVRAEVIPPRRSTPPIPGPT